MYVLVILCMSVLDCVCFFFKQKTAYEMRISDWSSDVCSSDLISGQRGSQRGGGCHQRGQRRRLYEHGVGASIAVGIERREGAQDHALHRTEERRVGKECVSTGRSRWKTDNQKQKKKITTTIRCTMIQRTNNRKN